MNRSLLPRLAIFMFLTGLTIAHADEVDNLILAKMREKQITGLQFALIDGGKIIKEQGYGFTDKGGQTSVTTTTLFQAGSVSKSVAAAGALHLVENKQLSLDADVNTELRAWKLPDNEFTKDKKVTLREILSHSAGLTVHGFPGYAAGGPMPTLLQVLDGTKPANTVAIRVESIPGSVWKYSGGGYTLLQQMMIDVTGQPFPEFMQKTVLEPFGMTHSTYQQPLPDNLAALTATGYYDNGEAVAGRWHVYPEMAAAGLWTTASDLARFVIGLQQSYAGRANPVLSPAMTREMLTVQKDGDGLGVFLKGEGETLRFMHEGRDEGFDAIMLGYANTGKGAVILINANDDSHAMVEILKAVGRIYYWPPL